MFVPGFTVWYSVSNVENTLAFYKDKLGFEVIFHDRDSDMAMVKTNTDHCVIGFSPTRAVVPSTASSVFDVQNIEEAVETLKAKGVTFVGDIDTIPGMVKLATFTDPDGHSLMLAQSL